MKKIVFLLLISAMGYAQADMVKFSGEIKNRNSDTIYIQGQNFKKAIPLNKKGVFSDSFAAPKGGYQLFDGTEYAQLILIPGFDLNMTMDAKQFDETITFTGKGAKENNLMAFITLESIKLETAMANPDQNAFNAAVAASTKATEAKLNDPELDAEVKAQVGNMVKQQNQQLAMMYTQSQNALKLNGTASPGFDYENHKGGKTKLSDFKGKYVYIDNWATWCGPCRAEIPHLQKVEEKYHGKNIKFVSISIDTKKDYEKWKKFVTDKKLGGVQLIADNDWSSEFMKAFGINSIPRFLLIGPDGKVVSADAPRPSSPDLQQMLDKLVK